MQIDRIILRDVGPFKDVTIELPPGKDPQLADVYLLTGPNGSGKSTVLYALGALLADCDPRLGPDLISRRFRTADGLVGLSAGDVRRVATLRGNPLQILDPLGGPALDLINRTEGLSVYGTVHGADYAERAVRFQDNTRAAPFSWAVFAYAGKRTLERGSIGELKELEQSPFFDSLSFADTTRTSELTSWIASQEFKRLKAQEAGRTERAARLGQSIQATERLIGQIIEDTGFKFVITDEDNDVRVRWNGKVVDLDLLPDGLKSITSWIADLLMRLDRIPWVDDLPVLQREFLLLLDEIDIHLHPEWQRKVLPFVQQMFPKAQIIATTHSPFVVASAADAHIVTFAMKDGVSTVENVSESQLGVSYSAVLRSIFGITSEFDVETERDFQRFHEAKKRLLSGDNSAREEVDRVAATLANRSEEVRELVALELAQLNRQRARQPQ